MRSAFQIVPRARVLIAASCVRTVAAMTSSPASAISTFVAPVHVPVSALVPPMYGSDAHKGSFGKVLIVGGSADYTGAPYYSAMAALKGGVDLVYIACANDKTAATALKSYSPEFIVLPKLPTSATVAAGKEMDADKLEKATEAAADKALAELKPTLERVDAAVVGPGLGTDPVTQRAAERIIEALKEAGKPTVFDADAISIVERNPALLVRHPAAVLTPNVAEFARLWKALHFQHPAGWQKLSVPPAPPDPVQAGGQLLRLLHDIAATHLQENEPDKLTELTGAGLQPLYVTLLRKGGEDIIVALDSRVYPNIKPAAVSVGAGGEVAGAAGADTSGAPTEDVPGCGLGRILYSKVDAEGSPRRCGGQGDVLAGLMGALLAWRHTWDSGKDAAVKAKAALSDKLKGYLGTDKEWENRHAAGGRAAAAAAGGAGGAGSGAGAGAGGAKPAKAATGWFDTPFEARSGPVRAESSPLALVPSSTAAAAHASIDLHGSPMRLPAVFLTSQGAPPASKMDVDPVPLPAEEGLSNRIARHAPARLQATVACGHAAARVLRQAAALAFAEHRRATTTPDIIAQLGRAMEMALPDTLGHPAAKPKGAGEGEGRAAAAAGGAGAGSAAAAGASSSTA